MKSAKKEFIKGRRLTIAETALMAQDALERARKALHNCPVSNNSDILHDLPSCGPDQSRPPIATSHTTTPLAASYFRGNFLSVKLTGVLGRHFEFISIGTCVALSASAWVLHLID